MNLKMMIGGKERTRKDWESLIHDAGLELVHIWQTVPTGPLAVIECMLKAGNQSVPVSG